MDKQKNSKLLIKKENVCSGEFCLICCFEEYCYKQGNIDMEITKNIQCLETFKTSKKIFTVVL
jgi:hypothetical protein